MMIKQEGERVCVKEGRAAGFGSGVVMGAGHVWKGIETIAYRDIVTRVPVPISALRANFSGLSSAECLSARLLR